MHFQNATNWNFQPQYIWSKKQYDIKESKIIPELQHVDLPRTWKRVLNEELHFLYSVHLGLEDSLGNVLKKGHCNCTEPCHLSFPCSMLHGPCSSQRKSNRSYPHGVLWYAQVRGKIRSRSQAALYCDTVWDTSNPSIPPCWSILASVNNWKAKALFLNQCFKNLGSFLNFFKF